MRSSRRIRRPARSEGSFWLSFSDLMSCLLLIFILIMFYIMYQYFDMYEISMAEIARQQYDLEQANADLAEQQTKLSEAESQMLAQQIKLNAAQKDLEDTESILAAQQAELTTAQTLLGEKEAEIAAQQAELDALSVQLGAQQTQINLQQQTLNDQQTRIDLQQQTLDDQQMQIENLVGLKTRIITSLSDALKSADISAVVDPASGAIALESDVLFSTAKYDLTESGQRFVNSFLPVYLDVLFSEEYRGYVSEIIIEGHTDSLGGYLTNLQLSQRRALAVATYILGEECTAVSYRQKQALREVITCNGRSFSDPVLDENGREDMDASRRVVFKFRLTDEQMIQQLKAILESSDSQEAPAQDAETDGE